MTALASAGAWLATWIARAGAAWGASGVWNSGTSYQTALGTMTADRDTWTGRANAAWGASGVWNTGQSFEALKDAVLGATDDIYAATVALAGAHGAGYVAHAVGGQTTVPKTGRYFLIYCSSDDSRGTHSMDFRTYRVLVNGVIQLQVGPAQAGYALVNLTVGHAITFQSDFTGGFQDTKGTIYLIFSPTSANPS